MAASERSASKFLSDEDKVLQEIDVFLSQHIDASIKVSPRKIKSKRVPPWQQQSAMTAKEKTISGEQAPTMAARLFREPGRQQPATDKTVIVQPWMTAGKKRAPATVKQQSPMAAKQKAETGRYHTSFMAAREYTSPVQKHPAMAARWK